MNEVDKNRVHFTDLNNFQVKEAEVPTKVRVLMLKGEKGESGGASSYEELSGKPAINGATLEGDMELSDIGLEIISEPEIDNMVN